MAEEIEQTQEITQEVEEAVVYDLHIKVPREMQATLNKSAQLAFKMGLTSKPTLAELMNLFIGWGLTILKKQWLDRMGYK